MSTPLRYFVYLRKSTDSEDRQVQSIEDQQNEAAKMAQQLNLTIIGNPYQESISAKNPGRPEFNKMLAEIKKGKADGIICWKLNRLARNPIDGGEIQWLLQQGIIKSIQTPGREYRSEDNIMMMSVELGMANQFIIDLRKDVKRGLYSKATKGWRPGPAPIGYCNDKYEEKGNKKILVDYEKFPLVRKMWDLMLTGNYTVPQIIEIANEKLGLRTGFKNKNQKLCICHGYKIFTNTFYYGEFDYSGKTYEGLQEKMITPEEYDHVQKLLGKYGKPRSKTKSLPFNGIIRCGECGCSITADEKIKYVKSIKGMKSYMFHRCTKRKTGIKCFQKPISSADLQNQINKIVDSITLPETLLNFALDELSEENVRESANRNILIRNQQKALAECIKKIDNLIKIYICTANANRELISDEEFKDQKAGLMKEKSSIQRELKNLDERVNEWIELTERTFKFATYAKFWFSKADYAGKTTILRALGSDFILKDGNISISLAKPYKIIAENLIKINTENATLEPSVFSLNKAKTSLLEPVSVVLSG